MRWDICCVILWSAGWQMDNRAGDNNKGGIAAERQALREQLIDAAMVHIPFDGWTHRAAGAGGS